MKTACHYAIARFMPFVETEEFVNVGVVLFVPGSGHFGHRLLDRHTRRIANFFEQVTQARCLAVLSDLREELERVSGSINATHAGAALSLWTELTKPRASVVRFSAGRVVLAANPAAKLHELYGYYVEPGGGLASAPQSWTATRPA